MSLRNTDVRTPGLAAIAKKWNLPVAHVAKLVEIGAKTEFEHNKNIAKARQVARDHIAERPDYYQKLKRMEKSPISMKEENSVSAVRGLGFVSGDPAVDPVSQYIDTNAMAYEDQNGNILKLIKKSKGVTSLGFTSYDPTEDHGDVKSRILGKKVIKELAGAEGGDAYTDYAGAAPLNVSKTIEAESKKAYNKVRKEDIGPYAREAINEIKASTVGRAVTQAAIRRKELTSGPMGNKDIKKWWKYQRLVKTGTEKLTGKHKIMPTLDEYANVPTNEYTKPYNTKSLVRSTRTSHEHIRKIGRAHV